MQIFEIFDTKIDITWQINGIYELAGFTINNIPYIIQIQNTHLPQNILPENKTAIISFFRNDIKDNEKAHSTTNDYKTNPSGIYGIVANALTEKFIKDNYDAFYFIADNKHSATSNELMAKEKIYSSIAQKMAGNTGSRFYMDKNQFDIGFLVSKVPLENNSRFIDEQLEALTAFKSSNYEFTEHKTLED